MLLLKYESAGPYHVACTRVSFIVSSRHLLISDPRSYRLKSTLFQTVSLSRQLFRRQLFLGMGQVDRNSVIEDVPSWPKFLWDGRTVPL